MAYTTTDLLNAVKRRAMLPAANGALSDDDILALATVAMRTQIQPLLRSLREDYSVVTETQSIVADQRTYPLPSRAEGGAVRDVWLVLVASPYTEIRVPYIPPEDRPMYQRSRSTWWDGLSAYTVEGNDMWIAPIPDSVAAQYSLVIRYYLRPGRFVPVSECDQVAVYNPGGPNITTAATSVFSSGDSVDVIGATPPFRPRIINSEVTVSGTTVDIDTSTAIIEAPVTGDYVCATDTTCVMTCPVEAQEALISATLVEVMQALGYERELATAVALRDGQMQAVRVLMEPRTEGAARVLVDPRSPLRRARRFSW